MVVSNAKTNTICYVKGCTIDAYYHGRYFKHGGTNLCQFKGCDANAMTGSLCQHHGASSRSSSPGQIPITNTSASLSSPIHIIVPSSQYLSSDETQLYAGQERVFPKVCGVCAQLTDSVEVSCKMCGYIIHPGCGAVDVGFNTYFVCYRCDPPQSRRSFVPNGEGDDNLKQRFMQPWHCSKSLYIIRIHITTLLLGQLLPVVTEYSLMSFPRIVDVKLQSGTGPSTSFVATQTFYHLFLTKLSFTATTGQIKRFLTQNNIPARQWNLLNQISVKFPLFCQCTFVFPLKPRTQYPILPYGLPASISPNIPSPVIPGDDVH